MKTHLPNHPVHVYILYSIAACYSTDIIGSCAFGLECNSFVDTDSPFMKYGRKIFQRNFLEQLKGLLTVSFPALSRALRLKLIPADVRNFLYDVVTKTVSYREKNNISRNDFLQLLIDIKNNEANQQTESIGKEFKLY